MTRRDRQLLVIKRGDDGVVRVVHCMVPSTPQTMAIRLRKGQQVVIEIEPDNTKAKSKEATDGK